MAQCLFNGTPVQELVGFHTSSVGDQLYQELITLWYLGSRFALTGLIWVTSLLRGNLPSRSALMPKEECVGQRGDYGSWVP